MLLCFMVCVYVEHLHINVHILSVFLMHALVVFVGGNRNRAGWAGNETVTDNAARPKDRKNGYVDNDDRTLLKV